MKSINSLLQLVLITLLISCNSKHNTLTIKVENQLNFDREEVVSLDREQLKNLLKDSTAEDVRCKQKDTYIPLQWVDYNQDGVYDELLLQAKVKANSSTTYTLEINPSEPAPKTSVRAYSRFVPERIDDYTWENDKVAFRTYGSAAKTAAENNIPGGVISSGIDLWFKSTKRSVIDDWYENNTKEEGYYHIDRGEGYDPYHVGSSRGTGGIGIYENDSLYVSENFITHKTIAEGPLRTIFELTYAPWSSYKVKETKHISLDIGSNFSKFEIELTPDTTVPNYAIGISLHDNNGSFDKDEENGMLSHWEEIDGHEVGEGILIHRESIDTIIPHISEVKDQSNALIIAKPSEKLSYYAGFACTKSNQIETLNDWKALLMKKKKIINHPLKVNVIH